MAGDRECVLAVAGAEVIGVGPVGEDREWFEREPSVTEVVRMPSAAAGRFLFQPWPGRDAALAILAEEAAHAVD